MKKRKLSYSPHLVTYIDILGFRGLIEKKDPNFISWAIRQVRELTTPNLHTNKYENETYVNFSDLIVHTVPLAANQDESKPFEIILNQISYFALVQAALIEKRLLLRGAITIGDMELSYGVLFGPGLISAYDLEREQALFPRIIVDRKFFETLQKERLLTGTRVKQLTRRLTKCLKRDDDGLIFLDYLGFAGHISKFDQAFLRLLMRHKELIQTNLKRFKNDKSVLSKYLWLGKYHNAFLRLNPRIKGQSKLYIDTVGDAARIPMLTT